MGIETVKILFVTAHPKDQTRIENEYDKVRSALNIPHVKKYQLLDPTLEVNFEEMLKRLDQDNPNILHFSGHSNEEGFCFKKSKGGGTQLIKNEELKLIFQGRTEYLKLVLLNSCLSAIQAQIISEFGIWVIGMNDEIDNDTAKEFVERFYGGINTLNNPNNIKIAIQIGCTNFVKENPEKANLISLWKDGTEVDYTKLGNPKEYESIVNALYNFNFNKQITLVEDLPKNPSFKVFSFDRNCKDEAKFIFKIIENKLSDIVPEVRVEVIKFSSKQKSENYIKQIDYIWGINNRRKPVIIFVKIDSGASKDEISKLICDYNNSAPLIGKYFFLLMFMSESFQITDCMRMPHSAVSSGDNQEERLKTHLEKWKNEFNEWIEINSNVFNMDMQKCESFYDKYIEEFVDFEEYVCSDDKYLFYFIKRFLQDVLNYKITFNDRDLNLMLEEIY